VLTCTEVERVVGSNLKLARNRIHHISIKKTGASAEPTLALLGNMVLKGFKSLKVLFFIC
jgi:hypothetical protein